MYRRISFKLLKYFLSRFKMRQSLDCTRDTDQQYNIADSMSRNRLEEVLNSLEQIYHAQYTGEEGAREQFKEAVFSKLKHLDPNLATYLVDGQGEMQVIQLEESQVQPPEEQVPSSQESIERLDRLFRSANRRRKKDMPLVGPSPFDKIQKMKDAEQLRKKQKIEVDKKVHEVSQEKKTQTKELKQISKSVKMVGSSSQRLKTESIEKKVWKPVGNKNSKAKLNLPRIQNPRQEEKPKNHWSSSIFNQNRRSFLKAEEAAVSQKQQQIRQNLLNIRRDLMSEIIKNRKRY